MLREDSGEYECYLANGQQKRVHLTVYGSGNSDEQAASSNQFNPVVEKEEGGSVELNCAFKNQPMLKWRKLNGVRIFSSILGKHEPNTFFGTKNKFSKY